ncbi:MAG TPA: hypothetical protein VGD99_24775 [Anaerolineae bacterium]
MTQQAIETLAMTPASVVPILTMTALPFYQQETPVARLINGLAVLILIMLIGLCLGALLAVLAALLPAAGRRSQAALLRSPWRAFFIGLANYLFLGGISLILLNTEVRPLALVGVIIAAALISITLIGLTGLVTLTGERLAALRSRETSPFSHLVWGTVTVTLAGLLPFIGWFLLAPVLLMVSFGAAVLAWRNRKHKEA